MISTLSSQALGAIAAFALSAVALAAGQTQVANSATEAKPLKVGSYAPDSTLVTPAGKTESLKAILGHKPTVLIFYRGGWCPFCNRHLADMESIEAKVRQSGFQIIAISPDKPAELAKTIAKHKLTYQLFSDSKAEALKKYGIAFRVDDPTFTMMRDNYKVNLESASGETHHILPVPSLFIVDRTGKIVYAHSNPDFKDRMKADDVLKIAMEIAGEGGNERSAP